MVGEGEEGKARIQPRGDDAAKVRRHEVLQPSSQATPRSDELQKIHVEAKDDVRGKAELQKHAAMRDRAAREHSRGGQRRR